MGNNRKIPERLPTMEMSKTLVSIISIGITVAITVGGWCYQNGMMNNKIENLENQAMTIKQESKEERLILKADLKTEIREIDKDKASKDIVELFLKKVDSIEFKLDRLIENNKIIERK